MTKTITNHPISMTKRNVMIFTTRLSRYYQYIFGSKDEEPNQVSDHEKPETVRTTKITGQAEQIRVRCFSNCATAKLITSAPQL